MRPLPLLLASLMIGLALNMEVTALTRRQVNLGPGGISTINTLNMSDRSRAIPVAGEVIAAPKIPEVSGATIPEEQWQGDYVYFGRDIKAENSPAIKWRVLHPNGYAKIDNNFNPCATSPDSILLFADQVFKSDGIVPLSGCSSCVLSGCEEEVALVAEKFNQQFLPEELEENRYFSEEERSSIMLSSGGAEANGTLAGDKILQNPDIGRWFEGEIKGRRVFLLSAAEITDARYGFSEGGSSLSKAPYAPLRSYVVEEGDRICFGWYRKEAWKDYGKGLSVLNDHTGLHLLACPALNLKLNAVLLISKYQPSKTLPDTCMLLQDQNEPLLEESGVEWKLTMFAENSLPSPEINDKEVDQKTNKVSFKYSFTDDKWEPAAEAKCYLSAILVDATTGEVLIYKKLISIKDIKGGESQINITLPEDYSNIQLFIFVEEDHGYISFASELVKIKVNKYRACEGSELYWMC